MNVAACIIFFIFIGCDIEISICKSTKDHLGGST